MRPSKFKDLTGQRFGRLVVLSCDDSKKCLCECACGKIKLINKRNVACGITVSCGCYAKELASERLYKHGLIKTKEYSSWENMMHRCYNIDYLKYKNYGGRGIRVCDEWRDFGQFYKDMGAKPSPKHSIDRINNDGNYEPGNCRWATSEEQSNNKSNNKYIYYNNKTLTLHQWSVFLRINYNTLQTRLRAGWDIDKTFTRPIYSAKRNRLAIKIIT